MRVNSLQVSFGISLFADTLNFLKEKKYMQIMKVENVLWLQSDITAKTVHKNHSAAAGQKFADNENNCHILQSKIFGNPH